MILFSDGRQFTIAGTVLARGETLIPISAVTIGDRPSTFPISTEGVTPPIIYVVLQIVGDGDFLAAMSMGEYNMLALAQSQRSIKQPLPSAQSFMQRAASAVRRGCSACGRK